MATPVPVVITQANGWLTNFITEIIVIPVRAWILMLLVPFVTDFNPSFWQSVAVVYIAGMLFKDDGWVYHTNPKKGAV